MGYRYKPSMAKRREFAETMSAVEQFCRENGIARSASSDSYYFTINGQQYRVSNHTIESSNAGAYNWLGEQTRGKYHDDMRADDVIYIHAGKTRIIDIYNDIAAGWILDGRGNRKAFRA